MCEYGGGGGKDPYSVDISGCTVYTVYEMLCDDLNHLRVHFMKQSLVQINREFADFEHKRKHKLKRKKSFQNRHCMTSFDLTCYVLCLCFH